MSFPCQKIEFLKFLEAGNSKAKFLSYLDSSNSNSENFCKVCFLLIISSNSYSIDLSYYYYSCIS